MSSFQDIQMSALRHHLLQQMECPICFKYMSPPIRMCSKGHSTCDTCTKKYSTCGKCQYPFLSTRNLALEAISFELEIQCNECKKKFTSERFYEHNCYTENQDNYFYENQNEWNENTYNCRISEVDENYTRTICRWTGFIKDVDEHFLTNHISSHFDLNESNLFKWMLPFQQDQENISVINYENNVFLQEVFYDDKKRVLYFSVFDINRKSLDEFYFKILIPKQKRFFKGTVLKKYDQIQNLKKYHQNILEVGIDIFDMPVDREISWTLSINKE